MSSEKNGRRWAGEPVAPVADYFDRLLFQGSLNKTQRQLLMDFANTNVAMRPKALNPASPDYLKKVQELVGLILSMPQWQFQ